MNLEDFLIKFKMLVIKNNGLAGDLEMTPGNYDDSGNLIKAEIPTITTDLCEVGVYGNVLYFVFIIFSNTYSRKLFDLIKDFSNIQIYGFRNFKTTLYPSIGFNYHNFEKKIKEDKYLQIQFNYDFDLIQPQKLYKEYKKIADTFTTAEIKIVNQIKDL